MRAQGRPGEAATQSRLWCSTAIVACQLLLAGSWTGVLAQSPVPTVPTRATQKAPPAPPEAFAARPDGYELVRITADRQEKSGHLYHLRGNVEIRLRDMRLTADEVDYDESSGDLDARGNVRFQREANQEDIHASTARYNLTTERGEFHQVRGTSGAPPTGPQTRVLTTTNPYYFEARRVEKVGDNTYILYDGLLTSCLPPAPIWNFTGSRAKIRPGEDVVIYNGFIKVRNKIPFFFSPIFYHSLKRIPRRSGFLTPNIGNSSRKGKVVGESFYWAINRSADAELGAEYYSKRGWAQRGTLRMRPHAGTNLTASYFGVVDRGLKLPDGSRLQQGGRTLLVTGTSELPRGFRAVADFNYLSSFQFRQAFTEAYLDAVNTDVHSTAFISNNFGGFSFNARSFRFQNFQSFTGRQPGDRMEIRSLPGVEFNSREQPLFGPKSRGRRWPLYFSFDAAAEALSRVEPRSESADSRITTSAVSRFDFYPRISAPLNWKGFHLLASYGVRATHYGARLRQGQVSHEDFQRTTQELDLDLRPPSLQRVFASPWSFLGERIKHVVEPQVRFRLVEGVNQFNDILRFDERDLVVDTREMEYGLTHRLFSKRSDGRVREVFAWELKQRYFFDPTFGGALVPGKRNVFRSTLDLTGYAFLDGRRRFSPITSLVRFMPAWNFGTELRADFDPDRGRFVNTGVTVNLRKGNAFASLSDFFVNSTPELRGCPGATGQLDLGSGPPTGDDCPESLLMSSNQLRGMLGYGFPNRRGFNVGGTFVYDLRQELMPYFSVQANYNFDCCGLSFEFRRFQFGQTVRDERQFRVAITFANIGSFGNLKKRERMF